MAEKPKVVTIGGGGGHAAVIRAIKDLPIDLTALVNMVDDGGSTGKIMRKHGVQSTGDVRQILAAASDKANKILQIRDNDGHAAGNLLLAKLEKELGSFQLAIETVRKQFEIPYHVFPLTENSPVLHALTASGEKIVGQAEIVKYIRKFDDDSYETIWIEPKQSKLTAGAIEALKNAQYIILTMGDLYSSIAPTFCIPELVQLWPSLKAKTIWLPNYAVTPGHGKHYSTTDKALEFLRSLNPAFNPNKIITADSTNLEQKTSLPAQAIVRGYLASSTGSIPAEIIQSEPELVDRTYSPAEVKNDSIDRSPIAYNTLKLHNIFKEILV